MFRFNFNLNKKVLIFGNRLLNMSFILYVITIWTGLVIWVIYNGGHIRIDKDMLSTVNLQTTKAIETNYNRSDFNMSYVKESEIPNYNRVWDRTDFVDYYPNEVHVMTNLVITGKQIQTKCADNPLLLNVSCTPDNNLCEKGFTTQNGIHTGRCVVEDFPLDHYKHNNSGYACEMEGWCPADRILVPLNHYKAVLLETMNSTLYIDNSVVFPNKNIIMNNLIGDTRTCFYHPITSPDCPAFKLGDIIRYSSDDNLKYEEMAKFGGSIIIKIEWNCFLPIFSSFDCKPKYSFKRVDVWGIHSHFMYYLKANYDSSGKSRELIRGFKIRFEVKVTGSISKYDFFIFLTISSAYTGIFSLMLWIFTYFVRNKYKNLNLDETIHVNQHSVLHLSDDPSDDEQDQFISNIL